jgi:hypothetical protein
LQPPIKVEENRGKKDIANTLDATTKKFKTNSTFLFVKGETELPKYHSGRLWQCQNCPASFDNMEKINKHVAIMKTKHQMADFGVPQLKLKK